MQFNILSLLLLSTLAACHIAFHQDHAVLSLSFASFCITIYSLAKAVRMQRTSAVRLVATGAISATVGMLAFGLTTIGTYWLHMAATYSFPNPQDLHIGYEMFFVLFIAIYGGAAAFGGAALGLILFVALRSSSCFNSLSSQNGGEPSVATEPVLHGFTDG
ncbi:MAG: hypothetical protein AAGG48_31505 [Planctomycetota bacterium]